MIEYLGKEYKNLTALHREKGLTSYATFYRRYTDLKYSLHKSLTLPPHTRDVAEELEVKALYASGRYTIDEIMLALNLDRKRVRYILGLTRK